MQVVGIVGTAKNTGKTTALTSILCELKSRNLSMAVTSIGYDGEDLDNLTFLPKPRIHLEKDTIIATSSLTLDTAKLQYEVLGETGLFTPLGQIIIAKVTLSGKIVIAGPNNIRDLKKIISLIKNINPDLLFIDGAMNRMAPMFLADKLIFSTGASRSIEIENISEEMKLIGMLFSKDTCSQYSDTTSCLLIKDSAVTDTGVSALLDEKDYRGILSFKPEDYDSLVIKGIFSSELLRILLKDIAVKRNKFRLVFQEPFRVLLSLNSISESGYNNIFPVNVDVLFSIKPKLIAVTVNSFFPKYENFHFLPGYVDKSELKEKVSVAVNVPVFDIFDDGSKNLVNLILN